MHAAAADPGKRFGRRPRRGRGRRRGPAQLIDGWVVDKILACIAVILAMGVALIGLSLRAIARYDR